MTTRAMLAAAIGRIGIDLSSASIVRRAEAGEPASELWTAIAGSSPICRSARYVIDRGENKEAQQLRTRAITSSVPMTLAKDSCIPANEVPSASSDVADERTATAMRSPKRWYSSRMARRTASGTSSSAIIRRSAAAALDSAAGSSTAAAAARNPSRSRWRMPPASTAWR